MKKNIWVKPPEIVSKEKTKHCHMCEEVKPLFQFYECGNSYRSSKCKACQLQSRKRPQVKKKAMSYKDYVKQLREKVGEENYHKYYELT